MLPSKLNPADVRQKYNSRSEIWPAKDGWHRHTHVTIGELVRRYAPGFRLSHKKMLNLGSGGNSYALQAAFEVQLDIAERHLPRNDLAVVGTAELLPFGEKTFDFVLCVGSVLNYCNAVNAIVEIARVLVPGGALLLEFESSRSAEYLGRSEFGRNSVLVSTTFQGETELLWIYNPIYIIALLKAAGLELLTDEGIHSITALAYRFSDNEDFAMRFATLDRLSFARRLFRAFSCNRILVAQKPLKGTQANF